MPKHNPLLVLDSIFRSQIFEALDKARYAENPREFTLPKELHEVLYKEISPLVKSLFRKKYSYSLETTIPSREIEDSCHDFLSHRLVDCFRNFNLLGALKSYISFSIVQYHKNRVVAEKPKKSLEQEELNNGPKAATSTENSDLKLEIEYLKKYLHDYPGNQDLIEAIFKLFEDGRLPAKKKQIFAHPDVEKWICKICCKERCPDHQKCEKCCLISHTSLLREWRVWKKYCERRLG